MIKSSDIWALPCDLSVKVIKFKNIFICKDNFTVPFLTWLNSIRNTAMAPKEAENGF